MKRDYRKNRAKVTDKIRETLAVLVIKEQDTAKKKKHPAGWYRDMLAQKLNIDERANPSLRSYEDALKSIRGSLQPGNPLDQPWHLDSITKNEYYIPPESLPTVLYFYKKRLKEGDTLTIREALWTARLCRISDIADFVCDWAFLYALHEMFSEKEEKKHFDSKTLELLMLFDPEYASQTKREIDIWRIAEKYGADAVKLKELNLSLEKTEEIAKSGKYKLGGDANEEKEAPKR
jgi:hypothetical protein